MAGADLGGDGVEDGGVELIGANREAIIRGEDREVFRQVMTEAGIRIPWSITVESVEQLSEITSSRSSTPIFIFSGPPIGPTMSST